MILGLRSLDFSSLNEINEDQLTVSLRDFCCCAIGWSSLSTNAGSVGPTGVDLWIFVTVAKILEKEVGLVFDKAIF